VKHFKGMAKPSAKAKPLLQAKEQLETLLPQAAGISAETAALTKEQSDITGQSCRAERANTRSNTSERPSSSKQEGVSCAGQGTSEPRAQCGVTSRSKGKALGSEKPRQDEFKAQIAEAKRRLKLIEQE